MADTEAPGFAAVVSKSPLKQKSSAPKAKPAAHPSTAVMVSTAIKELKEKKGSSLSAIKKYLAANYNVDAAKLAPFIRKYLKVAVAHGVVVQTKSRFKLAAVFNKLAVKKTATKKAPVAKKTAKAADSQTKKDKGDAKKSKSTEAVAKKANKPVAPKTAAKKSRAKAMKAPAIKVKAPKAKNSSVKNVAPKNK